MTVKELIEALSKFPDDMLVMRDDYEGGDTDITTIETSEQYYEGISYVGPPFILLR